MTSIIKDSWIRIRQSRAIFDNTSWMLLDRVSRMTVVVIIGVLQARYLGPEQFGLLSYVIAIVGVTVAIGQLGLGSVLVREAVKYPQSQNVVLGSGFILHFVGMLGALVLSVAIVVLLNPDENTTHLLTIILALGYLFNSFNVIDYWFQSQLIAKYSFWSRAIPLALEIFLTILLIRSSLPITYFVALSSLMMIVTAGCLIIVYQRKVQSIRLWKFDIDWATKIFKLGWPLALSAAAIMIYMRVDQVLIKQMLGDRSLGIYSAAVKISEVWYFVPTTIAASLYPVFVAAKEKSEAEYYQRFFLTFRVFVFLTLAFAIIITLTSRQIIDLIYGTDFSQASTVLSIYVWAGIPVALGVASSPWIVIEGHTWIAFNRTLFGALVNVLMNIALIPVYGLVGSAIATLVAYTSAGVIWHLVDPRTRHLAILQIKSLFLFIK